MGLCFLLGEPAGGTVMRSFFGKFVKHRPAEELKPQMNYPQFNMWKIRLGFGGKSEIDMNCNLEKCPIFFAYGQTKFFMYHTDEWLRNLMQIETEHPDRVRVEAFNCHHWVSIDKSQEYTKSLIKWLKDT